MVDKCAISSKKKYHCQWTLLRGEKTKWIFHNLGNLTRPLESVPASRERVVPAEWQVRTVHGDCITRAKVIPAPAPQYRQHAPNRDFRRSIGHELDQGPTRRVEATEPYVGHQDGLINKQFTRKSYLQTSTTQFTNANLWAQGDN